MSPSQEACGLGKAALGGASDGNDRPLWPCRKSRVENGMAGTYPEAGDQSGDSANKQRSRPEFWSSCCSPADIRAGRDLNSHSIQIPTSQLRNQGPGRPGSSAGGPCLGAGQPVPFPTLPAEWKEPRVSVPSSSSRPGCQCCEVTCGASR